MHQWVQDTLFLGPLPPPARRKSRNHPAAGMKQIAEPSKGSHGLAGQQFCDCGTPGRGGYRPRAGRPDAGGSLMRQRLQPAVTAARSDAVGDISAGTCGPARTRAANDIAARETAIHSCERPAEPCDGPGSSGECAGRRPRPGRERGGDLVSRSRRARMSFGPGGIAHELIDLPTEVRRCRPETGTKVPDQLVELSESCRRALACPHHL